MDLRDPLFWERLYDYILTDLGLDRDRDYHSCRVLDMLLSARMSTVVEARKILIELIEGKSAMIVGDSPNSSCFRPQGSVLIAADSSLEKCLEVGITPDIVTTDLDGVTVSSLRSKDTLFVVHAHGDNVERLERLLPEVRGLFIGTAQYKCSPRIEVPGGFTDGDRAAFLAYYYGARKVYLHGFSFSSVGRWLKPSGTRVNASAKLAKLAWARILLLVLKSVGYEVECIESDCEGWI